MINISNKIQKRIENIYQILKNRLPQDYIYTIYRIVYFENTKQMLEYEAQKCNMTYEELIEFYEKDFKSDKGHYRTIKLIGKINPKTPLDMAGIGGGNEIFISLEKLENQTDIYIAFFLLHEMGHNIFPLKNEKETDNFAYRWLKVLIKEELIKK